MYVPFAARLAFPWLDHAPWLGAAALAATVAALAAAPGRVRRVLLPAALLAWLAAGSSPAFAVAFAAAAWLQASVLRSTPALVPRLAASLACLAALLAVSRTVEGFAGAAAWHLAALAAVRAASAAVDAGPEGATARGLLLYQCGGLPASFLGAYHGYAEFLEAERLDRPRLPGLRAVVEGLAWLALSASVSAALGPARGPEAFTFSGLWSFSAAAWAADLAMWVGAYRVIEGLSRLSGVGLPSQFDKPWLASSPLDFWRRYSARNRVWLLGYVFIPLVRAGAPPPAAVAAVFAASAGLNALRFAGVFLVKDGRWLAAAAAATTFALFFAAAGAAAVAETLLRPAQPRTAWSRALRVAATTAAVVWLWAPMHFWPAPDRASPGEAASLWARVSGRLLAR